MKDNIFKKFLNGVSLAVISLLVVLSPFSAQAAKTLPKGKSVTTRVLKGRSAKGLSKGKPVKVQKSAKALSKGKPAKALSKRGSAKAQKPAKGLPKRKPAKGLSKGRPPVKAQKPAKTLSKRKPAKAQRPAKALPKGKPAKVQKSAKALSKRKPVKVQRPAGVKPAMLQTPVTQQRQRELVAIEQQQRQRQAAAVAAEQQRQRQAAAQQAAAAAEQQRLDHQAAEFQRVEHRWATENPGLLATSFVKKMSPYYTQDDLLNQLPWGIMRVQVMALLEMDEAFTRITGRSLAEQAQIDAAKEDVERALVISILRHSLGTWDPAMSEARVNKRIQAYQDNAAALQQIREYARKAPPTDKEMRVIFESAQYIIGALTHPEALDFFMGKRVMGGVNIQTEDENIQGALSSLNLRSLDMLMASPAEAILRSFTTHDLHFLKTLEEVHRITQILQNTTLRNDQKVTTLQHDSSVQHDLDLKLEGRPIIRPAHDGSLGGEAVRVPALDLGYGTALARTAQYSLQGDVLNAMNLPAAPVFHAYNPSDLDPDTSAASFMLNLKRVGYDSDFVPSALHECLERSGVEPGNIDVFEIWQDMVWAVPMALKPQSWVFPDTPATGSYSRQCNASTGVFSKAGGGPRLQGQEEGKLLPEHEIIVHDVGGIVVSSSDTDILEGVDKNRSQIIFSVTLAQRRAAVTKHVFWNKDDRGAVEQVLLTPTVDTYDEVIEELGRQRGRLSPSGGHVYDDLVGG